MRVNGETFFVSFDDYPGFRRASPEEIRRISAVYPDGVWWFHLDEGIEIDALRHPERYPLKAQKDGR